ncbi:MAG: hypothetical protein ACJA01_002124 [Saprospiraceae bacterium]|jgi:uncharacterized protein (DUF1684 family)
MKISTYWIFFLLIGLSISCAPSKRLSKSTLTSWQVSENDRFTDSVTSPLTPGDRETFKGLEFFSYDAAYKVVAKLERTPDARIFEMTTTTSRKPKYRQYGILTFKLKGQSLQLNVYQSQDLSDNPAFRKLLFLPFYDGSTGQSTYGGGRYINLTIPEGDQITIDFNEAYNPYCAYRDGFSCPITPLENNLESVVIMAGTKDFKKQGY